MKVLLQRVSSAAVLVDDEEVSRIGPGLLLLVGVGHGDSEETATALAEKIAALRIFSDDAGKFNHSLLDVEGEALVVSQFTLYADTRKGRRPSFTEAAQPEKARALVDLFAQKLAEMGLRVRQGAFGAHMRVQLCNDGPVTILLEN